MGLCTEKRRIRFLRIRSDREQCKTLAWSHFVFSFNSSPNAVTGINQDQFDCTRDNFRLASDLCLTSKGFLNSVKTVIFDSQILVSIALENAVIAYSELESRTRLNSTDLKLQAEKKLIWYWNLCQNIPEIHGLDLPIVQSLEPFYCIYLLWR